MPEYKEIDGDLIKHAKNGWVDVVVHGCNCFCTMGAGIAPQMAKAFGCDEFSKEEPHWAGDMNKLGTLDWEVVGPSEEREIRRVLTAVNAYTQYGLGANHASGSSAPVDYDAVRLCMRKLNHHFKGKHIGLPLIGCGLAGGDWSLVKKIIQDEITDCDVTVVHYKASDDEEV